MLSCAGVQLHLLSAICIHLAYRLDVTSAHFPTRALQQTPFLGTKVPFSTDSQDLQDISSVFPQKGWVEANIL